MGCFGFGKNLEWTGNEYSERDWTRLRSLDDKGADGRGVRESVTFCNSPVLSPSGILLPFQIFLKTYRNGFDGGNGLQGGKWLKEMEEK